MCFIVLVYVHLCVCLFVSGFHCVRVCVSVGTFNSVCFIALAFVRLFLFVDFIV